MSDDQNPIDLKWSEPPIDEIPLDTPQPDATRADGGETQTAKIAATSLLALIGWTTACDVLIFRTHGYSGPALLFALVPVFLMIGSRVSRGRPSQTVSVTTIVLTLSLLTVAVSLSVAGHGLTVFAGVVLTFALALACWGVMPLVLETGAFVVRVVFEGFWSLSHWTYPTFRLPHSDGPRQSSFVWSVLSPLIAVALFGGIFVFANPNLTDWALEQFQLASDHFWRWVEGVSVWEIPFCVTAFIVGAGLLYPLFPCWRIGPAGTDLDSPPVGRSAMFAPPAIR